jgi:hypothetical protein
MSQWWNDEPFIEELNKQSSDLKSGNDQGIAWEELKKRIDPIIVPMACKTVKLNTLVRPKFS